MRVMYTHQKYAKITILLNFQSLISEPEATHCRKARIGAHENIGLAANLLQVNRLAELQIVIFGILSC
jgi:hypothetical protein